MSYSPISIGAKFAESDSHIMLAEPAGLVNTGDNASEMTCDTDSWVWF